VEGEPAYKEAKAFMRMLMPSHAKKVQHYKDPTPLFLRHQVESQLEAIHSPIAQLKSGGYIVINPTEALVSIDVNSGKATKERNIEQTAVKTNIEAAEEAARQMRLRDLAGLLVIDFIDMDENKNVRAVEKKMKDALKKDRARLQVGRISQFGLMEMSRQRRRTSLVEGSTDICPHCQGTGYIRSIESSALVALRTLEEEGVRGRTAKAKLVCPSEVALYILNEKRDHLTDIETRYDMNVTVTADDSLNRPACTLERLESRREAARNEAQAARNEAPVTSEDATEVKEASEETENRSARTESDETNEDGSKKRRRRGRRGGRNRRKRNEEAGASDEAQANADGGEDAPELGSSESDAENTQASNSDAEAPTVTGLEVINPEIAEPIAATGSEEEKPKRKRPTRRRKKTETSTDSEVSETSETPVQDAASEEASEEEAPKPKRRSRRRKTDTDKPAEDTAAKEDAPAASDADASEEKPKPKRRTRRKKADAPAEPEAAAADATAPTEVTEAGEDKPKPRRRTRRKKAESEAPAPEASVSPAQTTEPASKPEPEAEPVAKAEPEPQAETPAESSTEDARPKRGGWWQRSSKFLGLN